MKEFVVKFKLETTLTSEDIASVILSSFDSTDSAAYISKLTITENE